MADVADFKSKWGQTAVTTAAAGNTQDFTISGFGDVTAAIFIISTATANDTIAADGSVNVGFIDSVNSQPVSIGASSDDNVTTTDTRRGDYALQSPSFPVRLINPDTGGNVGVLSFDSFITDGVRLSVALQFPSAYLISYCFIGGGDILNVHAGAVALSASPITTDVTDPGFEPTVLLVGTAFSSSVATDFGLEWCLGFAYNNKSTSPHQIDQGCMAYNVRAGVTTVSTAAEVSNTRAISHPLFNTTRGGGSVADFDANGFSLVMDTASFGNDNVIYLALELAESVEVAVESFTIPTTGDLNISTAFRPNFMLGLSLTDAITYDKNYAGATESLDLGLGIIVADDKFLSALSITEETFVTTTVTKSNLSKGDIRLINGDGSTVEVQSSRARLGPNGLSAPLTTNPGSAQVGIALFIGGAFDVGASFIRNTIVNADPTAYPSEDSPIISSPADDSYVWASRPDRIKSCLFINAGAGFGHAINLLREGSYSFEANQFTDLWLDGTSPDGNGTPDSALYNEVGAITLNIIGGGQTPTFLDKQSPGTTLNNNIAVTLTNLQPGTEVRVFLAEDFTSPIDTTEVFPGVEDSGSPSEYTFTAPAGSVVDIVVHNVNYVLPPSNRIKNFTVPTTDTSFPVSQIPDRNQI
jgi:hypothetical protein